MSRRTNRHPAANTDAARGTVRCAIYTRKSSEEGLEQEFNSLDAQRESAENFIASQKHAGWACLPERYDDGGFTGGNLERPAVQRLLADIEAGKIDCVVVYKVDRLSRSLIDFARMMETFERRGVSFVSVTQQFNTTHSMGRLTLNILLSFAQFEREIISERTRDKIAAARKKGRWGGGRPVLGYDIEYLPGGNRLVVNKAEAKLVRRIFDLYLEAQSVQQTIRRLDEMGVRNKAWQTKDGKPCGGNGFEKSTLFKLLTNVTYLGKVRYKAEVYDGLHEAIVDEDLFRRVGETLRDNRTHDGKGYSNKHGALLRGLVRCTACGSAMSHHFATDGPKRYRYYVCVRAQKRGWKQCPGPSLPANDLESFVIDQIRALGKDEALMSASILRAQQLLKADLDAASKQRVEVAARLEECRADLRKLIESGRDRNGSAAIAGELRERIREHDAEARQLDARLRAMRGRVIDDDELAGALEAFDPLWNSLTIAERERLIQLIVRSVEYDAVAGTISVTFHDGDEDPLDKEAACSPA
ncbi:MAG: recombinase family protein [Phycisphaeraceae bacterium]|nr:MAG: recombinase family protein [Phycisphaeraceae bacterium]